MTDLRTAAQQALEALEDMLGWQSLAPQMIQESAKGRAYALRAALAEPVQKPVAWYFEARHIDSAWAAAVTMKHPGPEGKYMRKVTPLYTALPPRKPLTREEAIALWADKSDGPSNSEIVSFTRAIERAHGIGADDAVSVP